MLITVVNVFYSTIDTLISIVDITDTHCNSRVDTHYIHVKAITHILHVVL